jgi:hypothetical protein
LVEGGVLAQTGVWVVTRLEMIKYEVHRLQRLTAAEVTEVSTSWQRRNPRAALLSRDWFF